LPKILDAIVVRRIAQPAIGARDRIEEQKTSLGAGGSDRDHP